MKEQNELSNKENGKIKQIVKTNTSQQKQLNEKVSVKKRIAKSSCDESGNEKP